MGVRRRHRRWPRAEVGRLVVGGGGHACRLAATLRRPGRSPFPGIGEAPGAAFRRHPGHDLRLPPRHRLPRGLPAAWGRVQRGVHGGGRTCWWPPVRSAWGRPSPFPTCWPAPSSPSSGAARRCGHHGHNPRSAGPSARSARSPAAPRPTSCTGTRFSRDPLPYRPCGGRATSLPCQVVDHCKNKSNGALGHWGGKRHWGLARRTEGSEEELCISR